jgi:hypothetical protein
VGVPCLRPGRPRRGRGVHGGAAGLERIEPG